MYHYLQLITTQVDIYTQPVPGIRQLGIDGEPHPGKPEFG